jgi:hypothetical protein
MLLITLAILAAALPFLFLGMATAQQPTNKPDRIHSKKVQGEIRPYRVVTFGDDDQHVKQAEADDAPLGVVIHGQIYDETLALPEGRMVDFATSGSPAVEYGGTVALGQTLRVDSQGRAVATGTGPILGIALWPGVAGDIGSVLIDR